MFNEDSRTIFLSLEVLLIACSWQLLPYQFWEQHGEMINFHPLGKCDLSFSFLNPMAWWFSQRRTRCWVKRLMAQFVSHNQKGE